MTLDSHDYGHDVQTQCTRETLSARLQSQKRGIPWKASERAQTKITWQGLAVPQIGKKLRLYESLPGDSFDGLLHELQSVPVVAETFQFAVNGFGLAVGEAAAVIVHAVLSQPIWSFSS